MFQEAVLTVSNIEHPLRQVSIISKIIIISRLVFHLKGSII